jgi:hypothetical protein
LHDEHPTWVEQLQILVEGLKRIGILLTERVGTRNNGPLGLVQRQIDQILPNVCPSDTSDKAPRCLYHRLDARSIGPRASVRCYGIEHQRVRPHTDDVRWTSPLRDDDLDAASWVEHQHTRTRPQVVGKARRKRGRPGLCGASPIGDDRCQGVRVDVQPVLDRECTCIVQAQAGRYVDRIALHYVDAGICVPPAGQDACIRKLERTA